MSVTQQAKAIIEKIQYITIASVSSDGDPWNSPVYSAYDEKYNFYWASWKENQHSKNIKENKNVFLVIYDSTAPEGTGVGVYIQAKAYEIADPEELKHAITYYPWRTKIEENDSKDFLKINNFLNTAPRRMYKAVPEKVWINSDDEINEAYVDKRIEIKLI